MRGKAGQVVMGQVTAHLVWQSKGSWFYPDNYGIFSSSASDVHSFKDCPQMEGSGGGENSHLQLNSENEMSQSKV